MGTEEFLTFKDLQALFKVSKSTIYHLIKRGMPVIKHQDVIRFPKTQVIAWFEGNSQK